MVLLAYGDVGFISDMADLGDCCNSRRLFVKCVRRQSFSVVRKIHWPGTIVIALIITALPAFFLYSQSSRVVNVPEGVAERPNISHLSKN